MTESWRVIIVGLIVVLAICLLLAAITLVGTSAIELRYPPAGQFADVANGRVHIVELGKSDEIPVVLLHGASSNLRDMEVALGARLARRHRVILIDRPGHGWSERLGGLSDADIARQAALIGEALSSIGVRKAIIVGHSYAGAVALAYSLAFPDRVAGLMLLAPVSHPWTTGISWVYTLTTTPVIGTVFAHTIVLPLALPLLNFFAGAVFAPQPMPENYVSRAATALAIRPSEFVANAQDVSQLLDGVRRQSPRYGEITATTVIVTGDRDSIVSPDIHARALARVLPHAKLTVLPGVGHAVQHVAADLIETEIDRLLNGTKWKTR